MKPLYVDPGEDVRIRGRKKRPSVKVPAPMSLFDISDEPPPLPFQIKSPTSIDAASEIREETKAKRRDLVYKLVKGSPRGLARFQLAELMDVPDHWCSSSVDALVKMGRLEEHPTRTIENPLSRKQCSIVVALESGEAEGAA